MLRRKIYLIEMTFYEFIICYCVHILWQPWKYAPQISKRSSSRSRLTDSPSCHFWIHHCFRAVFLGLFTVSHKYSVGNIAHRSCPTLSARQLWLGLGELFTELHCCLRLFPLHPSILFLLCVASLLLVIVPWSFTGVSPNTSVGICFSGPALTQYIRHNQRLISDLSGSDNPDPSEARATLPEKFIWN